MRWSKVVDGKGRKEGLFEWVVEVEAGEELTIETEWDVKCVKVPVSLRWFERVYYVSANSAGARLASPS
jgi:hypothetical protein